MSIYQHIPHGEILCHTHHCLINRAVTMWVVFPHGIPDDTRRFFIGLVWLQIHFVHGIEYTTLYRFQAVPHIGQRTRDNDAHGIVDITFFHFVIDVYVYNLIHFVVAFTHGFTSVLFSGIQKCTLEIHFGILCVFFDKFPSGFYAIAHQHTKDFICKQSICQIYLFEDTMFYRHCGIA